MKHQGRVFITGIAGFAGSYLAEYLHSEGYYVSGLLAPGERTDNIKMILPDLKLERFDILRYDRLAKLIRKIKPDYIFHLAAMSSVGKSFDSVRKVFDINFAGTLNLFESAKDAPYNPKKIIFVGSSDSYGLFKPIGKILKINQPFNPISPYGISKAAGEYLATYYCRTAGLPVVRARAFNHTGPKQTADFVVPSFCRQIARIEKGKKKPEIAVGNLSARRDISDVRDIVRGYFLMARKGRAGDVYQLCSGKAVAIQSVLNKLLAMSNRKIKITVDKSRLRKSDIPVLRGDNSKTIKDLGWKIRYKLNDTLKDTLEYWREVTA